MERRIDPVVAAVAGVGALASVCALGLPLYSSAGGRGPAFVAAWFGHVPWGWDTWGQAAAAVTVAAGAWAAVLARRMRAVALLAGCSAVVALYLVSWPLTSSRVPDPRWGPGVVAGAVGVVTLAGAAALVLARRGPAYRAGE